LEKLRRDGRLSKLHEEEYKIYERFLTLLKNQVEECEILESSLTGKSTELVEMLKQMGKISDYFDQHKLMLSKEKKNQFDDCRRKSELLRDCFKVDKMDE
jgi:hypothetical protein